MENVLASICKDLRLLGDDELTQIALQAYAAITDIEDPHVDLSYTHIMRQLRKGDKDRQIKFQTTFKKTFEDALYADVEDPESIALISAMAAIDYKEK